MRNGGVEAAGLKTIRQIVIAGRLFFVRSVINRAYHLSLLRQIDVGYALIKKLTSIQGLVHVTTERLKQAEPGHAETEEPPVNFDKLVEDCQAPLLRYANRLTRNEELARDIVQEAFIRYLEAPPRARAQRQIVTWLYRVTHNLAMNALSNERRRSTTQIPDGCLRCGGDRLSWSRPPLIFSLARLTPRTPIQTAIGPGASFSLFRCVTSYGGQP